MSDTVSKTTEPPVQQYNGPQNLVAVMSMLCIFQVVFFAITALVKKFNQMYWAIFIPADILYHALVTYFLFTLRTEFRYSDTNKPLEKINLANLFTLFRISAMPSLLTLIIASKDYQIKLILLIYVFFVFISDFFDGFISRKLKEITHIGKILDSTSDYLILFVVGVSYLYYHMISMTLFFVLLLRLFTQGFIQIIGLIKTSSFNIRSTIFGKIAVASTMVYFFIVLIKFFYVVPYQVYDLLENLLIGILCISIIEKFIVLKKFLYLSKQTDTSGGKEQ
ncbi:MAG TPA: CDP-alcohol phosphatidyltransferase family protein [Spirochaetia bacterium]|nr:CDP-alcohol phosphatidyltransferase family protein [Spirochaetales bacterium]HPD80722.1 CDP-alcohol phosphatidyltransferase family protein [Spirochaetales bacterium]HQK35513.1 CDP-alcohol phosphatidyltransferase family protein [Spirochaetales bacterium]HRS64371.1 CDP-alcohol phosphatidyltransferase family protein [Spirochaetia bacterium]HRV27305.1 CDP-alcohol phosphatidyltransferase family protein [Spirochaetia bacterium]